MFFPLATFHFPTTSTTRWLRKLALLLPWRNYYFFPYPRMSATDEERQSDPPPSDRSAWRDTWIYSSGNRDNVLGGLLVAEGMTNANLYSMLEIFCSFTDTFTLQNDSELLVENDAQKLQPGNYYIVTNGNFSPSTTFKIPATRYCIIKWQLHRWMPELLEHNCTSITEHY